MIPRGIRSANQEFKALGVTGAKAKDGDGDLSGPSFYIPLCPLLAGYNLKFKMNKILPQSFSLLRASQDPRKSPLVDFKFMALSKILI